MNCTLHKADRLYCHRFKSIRNLNGCNLCKVFQMLDLYTDFNSVCRLRTSTKMWKGRFMKKDLLMFFGLHPWRRAFKLVYPGLCASKMMLLALWLVASAYQISNCFLPHSLRCYIAVYCWSDSADQFMQWNEMWRNLYRAKCAKQASNLDRGLDKPVCLFSLMIWILLQAILIFRFHSLENEMASQHRITI